MIGHDDADDDSDDGGDDGDGAVSVIVMKRLVWPGPIGRQL